MKLRHGLVFGIAPLALAALFAAAACNGGDDNSESGDTPLAGYAKDVAVYVKKPAGWAKLYAYVWDAAEKEYAGAAPGTELTALQGDFYSYQAKADYGYLNVRFSDGSSKSSFDILGVDKTTYYESTGSYAQDASKVIFRQGASSAVETPRFYSSAKTSNTVTLNWDPVPGIDAYILYYVVPAANGAEYWYFVTAQSPGETSFVDINHGQYFYPETEYKWKLHAVKYKADLSGLDALADITYVKESKYAEFCDTVYNYGELAVTTAKSPLSAPANLRIQSATNRRVELKWDPVPGMGDDDFYVVFYAEEDDDSYWEWEYTKNPECVTEADEDYTDNDWFEAGDSFMVIARKGNGEIIRSGDSNEVVIESLTPAPAPSRAFQSDTPAPRAAAPASISAKANDKASMTINVEWAAVAGAKKYTVGLFSSPSSSTPSKTVNVDAPKTSVPFGNISPGVYYVGVKAASPSSSSYIKTTYTVSPFPKDISIKSKPTFSKMSNDKQKVAMNVKMNGTWKSGAVYGYLVTVEDNKGEVYYNNERKKQTNSFVLDNLRKGPQYSLNVIPFTGDSGTEYSVWKGSLYQQSALGSK